MGRHSWSAETVQRSYTLTTVRQGILGILDHQRRANIRQQTDTPSRQERYWGELAFEQHRNAIYTWGQIQVSSYQPMTCNSAGRPRPAKDRLKFDGKRSSSCGWQSSVIKLGCWLDRAGLCRRDKATRCASARESFPWLPAAKSCKSSKIRASEAIAVLMNVPAYRI